MRRLWLLLALPIVALDQWVKWWVGKPETLDYILLSEPSFLGVRLTYTENTGAALSFLANVNARWFLVAVSALASVFIVVTVCKRWIWHPMGVISLSCVLGGAVGNLIDRAARGYVIDMFNMHFFVCNVADVFVSVGGACFALYVLVFMRKKEPDAAVDENG